MAEITAQAVNEFRKRTGLGLMECKALLKEADGDLAKAETLAKEKGLAKASGRSGRATSAGRIEAAFNADHTAGAMVELKCETDFVARNDAFRQAAKDLAEQVLAQGVEGLLDQAHARAAGKTVREAITDLNVTTGENVAIGKTAQFAGAGRVEAYVHHDAKSGALVEVAATGVSPEELSTLARDIALQVVAAKPLAVDRDEVSAEVVAEQKRIYLTQVATQMADKPEPVREKIATGKLDAWFRENTLLDQEYVKDPTKKVRDVLSAVSKDAKVVRFARFVVGDTEAPAADA